MDPLRAALIRYGVWDIFVWFGLATNLEGIYDHEERGRTLCFFFSPYFLSMHCFTVVG
jgi:hypothetical protein